MPKDLAKVREVFRNNKGILRSSRAEELGINRMTLSRLTAAGLLIREAKGLYRLPEFELSDPDLATVSLRIPQAVICLLSALSFHELTDHIPHKIYIALPRPTKKPFLDYPPIDVTRVNQTIYSAGVESHSIDGVLVHIYSQPKTVADCFKFRNKVGEDVALEALRNYLRGSNVNIDELLNCARIDRVEKIMRPYIRASL